MHSPREGGYEAPPRVVRGGHSLNHARRRLSSLSYENPPSPISPMEQLRLVAAGILRRPAGQPQVRVGAGRRHPPPMGAVQETALDEERLVDLLERVGVLA